MSERQEPYSNPLDITYLNTDIPGFRIPIRKTVLRLKPENTEGEAMKREYKFRGKANGHWWYATPEDDKWEQFWAICDKSTVGQYIGSKDKNGKEIYEDDIIKADWHWNEPHKIEWPEDYYNLIEYGLDSDYNLEVIGNIYDTPELMKEAQ